MKSLHDAVKVYGQENDDSDLCKLGVAITLYSNAYIYLKHADDLASLGKTWIEEAPEGDNERASLWEQLCVGDDKDNWYRKAMNDLRSAEEKFEEENHLMGIHLSNRLYI